ncbi:MAG: DUF4381 domain-containing protein [Bacteroidota bacterium]
MILSTISPIFEPDAIRFSFNTPAWFVLGGMLILFALWLLARRIKHYRKNAYRRAALRELRLIENDYKHQKSVNLVINDVLILLKIVAIKAFGRKEVANKYGEEWLKYLESSGKKTAFLQHKSFILDAIYRRDTEDDKVKLEALIALTEKWIKTHA